MYKVLIIEDQVSSQEFMKYSIKNAKSKFKLCEVLNDADSAIAFLKTEKIDLILLDIHTNGKENGLKVARSIKESYPEIKIIVLTFLIQKKYIDEAHAIGIEGFWHKDYTKGSLTDIIENIMKGETFYPQSAPVVNIGLAKSNDFTQRELEVLQAKVNGLTNSEACTLLGIKERTLDDHIRHLKEKTGYDSLLKLVADVSAKKFIITQEK